MPDGRTRRDHLLEVVGRMPSVRADLTPPPVDPADAWLLPAFAALDAARDVGLGGPKPLAWSELGAWLRVTGTPITHEDLRTIRELDDVTRRAAAEGMGGATCG